MNQLVTTDTSAPVPAAAHEDRALPRAFLDASPFATLFFTPDLRLLDCNAAHTRNTGVAAEALRGRAMFEVFPKDPKAEGPDTEEAIRASVARAMATGKPDEPPVQKHDLMRPDGSFEPRYWRIINSPVFEGSQIVAIRQDSWDVTASVQEAERQAALQRIAGSMAGIAFWELDPATDRIACTPEFDALFGFPMPEGAPGARTFSPYRARIHEGDQDAVGTAIEGLMTEGYGAVRQLAYRVVRPDGEIRDAMARGETTIGPAGQPVLLGITFDVTELRAGERRLAELVEQKEVLLGEVNHRVKNSLQLVGAMLSLEARAAGADGAGRLRSAARRVQAVAAVHAALYQGGDVRSIDMAVHLPRFVDRLGQGLGIDARGIAIETRSDELRLHAEKAVPLSVIVSELVTNAVKHGFGETAPAGARIAVRLAEDEAGRLALTVADNGCGGAAGRRDAMVTGKGLPPEGGLGSALVSTLSRQLGGAVSTQDDNGWTVRVVFDR